MSNIVKSKLMQYASLTVGSTDYIENDVLHIGSPIALVLVSSAADLVDLATFRERDYKPGTIAYTAGFNQMWQKAPDGTWASFE